MPVLLARERVAIRKCLDSPVARDTPEHGDKSLRSGERALDQNSCVVQAVAKCNGVQHKLSIVRGNRVSSHGVKACAPLDVATCADFKGLCFNHDPSAEGKSSERFAAIICSSSADCAPIYMLGPHSSSSALSSAAFVMTTMLMRRLIGLSGSDLSNGASEDRSASADDSGK